MKLLVDTNVFLELLLKRECFQDVINFFKKAVAKRNQTYMTAMSLRDIGYIVQKYTHSQEKTKLMQLQTYQLVSKVINTTADAAIESIYSETKDYEDSLQLYAAEENLCDAIITFNKKDYQQTHLPVFTPKEICDIWTKENAL